MKFSLFKKKNTGESFEDEVNKLREAAEQNPDDPRGFTRLAELYLEHGQQQEAIQEYHKAAKAATHAGKDKIVIAIYKHMLTIDPGQADVYNLLCDMFLKNHFIGDAVDALLQQAGYYFDQDMKFEAAQTLKSIGDIDQENKFYKTKVEKFFKARNITPEEAERLGPKDKWLLVKDEVKRDSTEESVPGRGFFDLENALDSSSINTITSSIGDAVKPGEMLDPNKVFDKIESLMEAAPEQETPEFHFTLAQALMQRDELEKAVSHAEKALAGEKNRAACYMMLLEMCRKLKRGDDVLRHVKSAMKDSSLSARDKQLVQYQLGMTYKAQGDNKNALKIFKKLYDQDKTFTQALNQLKQLR